MDQRFIDLGNNRRRVVNFTPRLLFPRGWSPGAHWIGDWLGPDWSASRPGCFTPGNGALGAHWIGDWLDPEWSATRPGCFTPGGWSSRCPLDRRLVWAP
jgi:hypothetical protein